MTPLDGHRVDVLVTGAAGFVGEALVGRLLELGRRAVGVDLRAGYHPTVRMDVTDPAEVDDVFARYAPAKVVHAAAVVDERVPPATTRRVNVEGTRNVLDACVKALTVLFRPSLSQPEVVALMETLMICSVLQVIFQLASRLLVDMDDPS